MGVLFQNHKAANCGLYLRKEDAMDMGGAGKQLVMLINGKPLNGTGIVFNVGRDIGWNRTVRFDSSVSLGLTLGWT